ncbi:lytic transglycosylase domain-containing protein [Sphingomonas oligoaromativorans]|uniref:lytic transglycosylase domain-containing protein n=1 Tax=Sphingomonas oligoaromativorans TaxID=575322 RepID=UPI001FB95885|nr:lytic transglycosylase domain-containing protein [Sphingomonas oligoaromativorans]NIJ34070.1 soluble lytic murein transglycosylase-like protein [Sphingomonas oligoaromativorans]
MLLIACDVPANADALARPSPIAAIVTEAAQRAGIPESWIWSVMRIESAGDMHAVSRAGAMGLMQLMPATWADMRLRLRLGSDPFDPHDNIVAGAFFLRAMHDRYGEPGFLAAYNAGPGRYEDYLYRHRPLPAETTAYLARLAPAVRSAPVADPNAWTRASLFVSASPDRIGASPVPANDKPNAPAPTADPLFVRTANAVSR